MKEAMKKKQKKITGRSFILRSKRASDSWWNFPPDIEKSMKSDSVKEGKRRGRPTLLFWVYVEIIYGEGNDLDLD